MLTFSPSFGDFARHYDMAIGGVLSTHFAWLNRGKRSVALGLACWGGAQILNALLDCVFDRVQV